MWRAREREAWNHTSFILATLYNAQRGKGQAVVKPWSLNPLNPANQRREQVPANPHGPKPIHALKAFLKK